jgi:pSer/pThr/pTyr-binding forkhead associated (FHA) protein
MDVQMLVVQGKPRGHCLRFPIGEFVFGRGPECHIRPNSEWVSRQHCMLRVARDAVHIRDLGSTNGTLVNGSRLIGEQRLEAGDQLQIGPLVLQLVLDTDALPGSKSDDTVHDAQVLAASDTTEVRVFSGPSREAT